MAKQIGGILIWVAALALVGSAALKWWHVMGAAEPACMRGCRLLMGVLVVTALVAFFVARLRTPLLVLTAYAALLTPLLVIVEIIAVDAGSISTAITQINQSYRLIRFIQFLDKNPGIPWTEDRGVLAFTVTRDDYTLTDAFETAMHYTLAGWHLALLAGMFLTVAAWAQDAGEVRAFLKRWKIPLVALPTLFLIGAFTGPIMGYWHYTRGSEEQSRGESQAALRHFQAALRWDKRLNYDDTFNFDLGRVYASLGRLDKPEYWSYLGDVYFNTGRYQRVLGYDAYRNHIPLTCDSPSVRVRYGNVLLLQGADAYKGGSIGTAIDDWNRGLVADPTNMELRYAEAQALTKAGTYRAAIAAWSQLIKDNDDIGLYRFRYVTSYTFRSVISAHAWGNMAWCYFQIGDLNNAVQCKTRSQGGKVASLDQQGSQ